MSTEIERVFDAAMRRANRRAWRYAIVGAAVSTAVGGILLAIGAPVIVASIGVLVAGQLAGGAIVWRLKRRDRR